jgi:hypothetical protein
MNIRCIVLLLLLCGCAGNSIQNQENIPVIDLSRDYPEKKISFQELGGEIEYIPLETTDDALIDKRAKIVSISDKYIIITNDIRGDVFTFGRDGKIISYFNHKGQSGEEYIQLRQLIFDEKNQEFYVLTLNNIIVYSEKGQYKRTLTFPEKTNLTRIYNFNDETLFGYDEYGILGNEYNTNPYLLISKKEGSIVSTLERSLPKRYADRLLFDAKNEKGENQKKILTISGYVNNWSNANNFVISDLSSDTIFQLTRNKKLIPLVTRKPSVHEIDIRTFLTSEFKTDKFMLFNYVKINFEKLLKNMRANEGYSISTLLYDFANNQIYDVQLYNADCEKYCCYQFADTNIAENSGAVLMNIYNIISQKDEVSGKLKQIAKILNEEDNPVLMIVKFK